MGKYKHTHSHTTTKRSNVAQRYGGDIQVKHKAAEASRPGLEKKFLFEIFKDSAEAGNVF